MSKISNVIFSFDISEGVDEFGLYDNIQEINKWLDKNYAQEFSDELESIIGGWKRLETPIFVAAFNYFNLKDFCDFICSLYWIFPNRVQIFIQEHEDKKFRLIEPFENK